MRRLATFRKIEDGFWFYHFVVWILRRLIELRIYRVEEGIEKIPATGGLIVIAPHLDEFDALIAPEVITRAGRMPRIFAKADLWKIPVVKQAFDSGKLISVERDSKSAADSLLVAKEALENQEVVLIFPEGTCSRDPESWPMTCKTGAARLALQTGAPVVVIMQDGAQFLGKTANRGVQWSSYFFHKKHTKRVIVYIKVYEPIDFSAVFTDKVENPTDEQIMQVNFIIEDFLTSTIEENRGYTAPSRWDAKSSRRVDRKRLVNLDVW
jgi:1-acyl-sn-glycerol-3-phosphate acyltransferase